jgi:hypothetical protein
MTYFWQDGKLIEVYQVNNNNELKIKKETFPFDWIFSNTQFVYESLSNNFTLLRKMVDKKQNDTGNIYKNFPFNGIGIPHHNLKKDITKEYFEKRINNLYKVLNSGKNIIFIHINGSERYDTPYEQFEKIIKLLNEKFTSKIKIISITLKHYKNYHNNQNNKKYELIKEINDNNIELKVYHIYTKISITIANWNKHGSEYIKNCKNILIDNNVNFDVVHTDEL